MRRRAPRRCILVLALSCAAVAMLAPRASPSDFVTVEGSRFRLHGGSYHFAGANCYYLMTWAAEPSLRPFVDEVLEEAALMGMTVVRTWAFNDGDGWNALQTAPRVYDEAVFEGLDYVVQKGSTLGLRLVLTLVNNWVDYGGMDQYVTWSPRAQFHDDFYSDDSTRTWYRGHCSRVVGRVNTFNGLLYRDDPTILAWELANEPRCPSDPQGNTLATWITEMSAHIQSLDPNHLVTTGIEGFYDDGHGPWYTNGSEGVDFLRDHQVTTIDYATAHSWPDHWGFDFATTMALLSRQLDDASAIIQKPFVLEEFGKWRDGSLAAHERAHYDPVTYFSPGVTPYDVPGATPLRRGETHAPQRYGDGSVPASTATRDFYFQAYCDSLLAHAAGGSSVWILYHDTYPDYDGFGVYHPADTSTVAILEAHAAAMTSLSVPTDVSPEIATAAFTEGGSLGVPYPNPFNPRVTLRVDGVHEPAFTSVRVYDLRGRLVQTLFSGMLGAGGLSVSWDGTSRGGAAAPSGAFLVRLDRAGRSATRRVVLLR
ncbi:MAG: cellulase family glycosylhydrolase [Candidatus Latescibacterota bacterium]|nr:MAG: cellulase family glycosylhydrolase [Candidatus Latescibacterota bacterium]